MKTTLTPEDFGLLTFAAGVLWTGNNGELRPLSENLQKLVARQRALLDEPDAKDALTAELNVTLERATRERAAQEVRRGC